MQQGATSPSVWLKLPWEQFGSLERFLRGKCIWQTLPSTPALLDLEDRAYPLSPPAALLAALEMGLLLLKLGVLSGPVIVYRGAKPTCYKTLRLQLQPGRAWDEGHNMFLILLLL